MFSEKTSPARSAWEPQPDLKCWVEQWTGRTEFVQVLITQIDAGYDLRHTVDADRPESILRRLGIAELRELVQYTRTGAFRPNKLSPNLRSGWRCLAESVRELGDALRLLYPGGLADWYAEHRGLKAKSFREYLGRQTGMYRVAQQLTDNQAAHAVRANCDSQSCRRRRIWEVPLLSADEFLKTSLVPCFEPCGTMMEMARRVVKSEQVPKIELGLTSDELDSTIAAVERALEHPDGDIREGDLAEASNVRRLRLALQRFNAAKNSTDKKTAPP